jgi:undecaprenyl-phosphate galactose phosphotransferase
MLSTNPRLKDEYDSDFKLMDDPRITPIGWFLRRTSLDELPQLFNVFLG